VIRIYDFLFIQEPVCDLDGIFPSHTLGSGDRQRQADAAEARRYNSVSTCAGMAVAHQVGIVHRDLKPANVLINDEGLLKIVDFGVAAAQSQGDTQLTKTGYRDRLAQIHGAGTDPGSQG
jgi:serine/threonine-protein kinase